MRRPKITVIGEGLTERWYFNHLRSVKGFKYDCKPRFFSEQSYSEMENLLILSSGKVVLPSVFVMRM